MQQAGRYHRHLFIGALLLAVLASGCAGSEAPPGESDGDATIVHSGEDEAFYIPFEDDGTEITLLGHFYGPLNEVGVILSHMLPSDQSAWAEFAKELAEEDYAVVTFDFRGFGETGGERDLSKLDEDLSRVVSALRDRDLCPCAVREPGRASCGSEHHRAEALHRERGRHGGGDQPRGAHRSVRRAEGRTDLHR